MKMAQIETAIHIVLEFNEAFNRHDVIGMMQLRFFMRDFQACFYSS